MKSMFSDYGDVAKIKSLAVDDIEAEVNRYRKLAFVTILVGTFAMTTSVVVVPLLYNYVQYIESQLNIEIDFCAIRTDDLHEQLLDVNLHEREKRRVYQMNYEGQRGGGYLDKAPSVLVACCSCGNGPPGQPGARGYDGRDGVDGLPGDDGPPGTDSPVDEPYLVDWCFDCTFGDDGSPGPQGPPGPKGQRGQPGVDGENADRGLPGAVGPQGPVGRPGLPGSKGVPGLPGTVVVAYDEVGPVGRSGPPGKVGNVGAPGANGKMGLQGPMGIPGDIGKPGRPGNPGRPGANGNIGTPGFDGSCDHCPLPRIAPGYYSSPRQYILTRERMVRVKSKTAAAAVALN